jgi:hypothetical protein
MAAPRHNGGVRSDRREGHDLQLADGSGRHFVSGDEAVAAAIGRKRRLSQAVFTAPIHANGAGASVNTSIPASLSRGDTCTNPGAPTTPNPPFQSTSLPPNKWLPPLAYEVPILIGPDQDVRVYVSRPVPYSRRYTPHLTGHAATTRRVSP